MCTFEHGMLACYHNADLRTIARRDALARRAARLRGHRARRAG